MTSARCPQPPIPDALVRPLRDLSRHYRRIADAIDLVIAEVGEPPPGDRTRESGRLRPQRATGKEPAIHLDLTGPDVEQILDVIDQLAGCPGVEQMSVTSIEGGRASVVLHLGQAGHRHSENDLVVVCARCDRVVSAPGVRVSHGLCDDCAEHLRSEFTEA